MGSQVQLSGKLRQHGELILNSAPPERQPQKLPMVDHGGPSLFPLFVTQASGYRWKLSHEKGHGTSMEHHENNVKQCEAVKPLQNNNCLAIFHSLKRNS